MTEFQSDPVVHKCVILQDKLNALLSNLKNESSGLSKEGPTKRGVGNGRGFVEREAVMARANSLKKALRGVIDVTEKGDYTSFFLSLFVFLKVGVGFAHSCKYLSPP